MSAVYALYDDGDAAQRAVNALRRAGIADTDITVITGEPMEDFEFSHIGTKSRLWYVAAAGGVAGCAGATWLTRMTERAWPLATGNMPIVAWWPNLIVIFEMTMLGAILATVASLIVTAGLLRRRPALYDPAITAGKILVGVEGSAGSALTAVEQALLAGGNAELKRS